MLLSEVVVGAAEATATVQTLAMAVLGDIRAEARDPVVQGRCHSPQALEPPVLRGSFE